MVPVKVTRRLANGRTKVFYRYANGFESGQEEGSEKSFWPLVNKTEAGCWLWRGRTNTNHNTTPEVKHYLYGVWRLEDGTETGAHRAAWHYMTGSRLPKEVALSPICGDHMCVNPEHYVEKDK